ncbi:MAG TPA: PorV/PorQ family protein [Calditrichaeota bacterium]|nr:PorV/PorQ family protein [Calditrichota bacterium]
MKTKYVLIFIMVSALSLYSQTELSKVGTSMAQFLKLGAGARGTAMGDAYTSMVQDVSALYWNPAGLRKIGRSAVGVSRTQLFAGITYDFVGAVYPVNHITTVGVSVLYLNSGEMELTTLAEPEGTGTTFDASSSAIGVSVAHSLTDRFDLGVTIKYVTETLFREEASTLAFDVGSQFRTGIYGMRIGMALSNFGGKMKLDGPDLDTDYVIEETSTEFSAGSRLKTEEWPIPLLFRLGVNMDLIGGESVILPDEKNRVTLAVEGNDPVDHFLRFNFGLEYEWSKFIALRFGYKDNYDAAKFTAGFGLDFSKLGIDARMDYAFNDYGILGFVHNYSLEFMF